MVIMASGIARGRVRTTATATVESRNVTAILQITGSQRYVGLVYCVLPCIRRLNPQYMRQSKIRCPTETIRK